MPTSPSKPIFRALPLLLALLGGGLCLLGGFTSPRQFAFSYLAAFMFFLSLSLGALFLVMMHHLFDTQWMVPLRRVWEHLACLFPVLALLFLPIALNSILAGKTGLLYSWMETPTPTGIFNLPAFYGVSALLLITWSLLGFALLRASLAQDATGATACTIRMRRLAAGGMFLYAITLTLGAVYWMQSLERPWFSSMYGVYFFSGSVWATLAITYLLTLVWQRTGSLRPVVRPATFHDLGVLFLAFTIFYAYIAFSQYFLIWNADIPEETYWFANREQGTWRTVGLMMIFGHFFLPFLALLRQGAKRSLWIMLPLCAWALGMHYLDLTYNIKPVLDPDGLRLHWLDFAAFAFIGGLLTMAFLRAFRAHAPYPQRDPRLAETLAAEAPSLIPVKECGYVEPWQMQGTSTQRRWGKGIVVAILLSLLLALAWNLAPLLHQPAPNAKRIAERTKALAEVTARDAKALTSYGWQDESRNVVRLPIQRALELMPPLWQDPAAGRSNLLQRLEKSLAKPVEKPNPYE